VPTPSVPSEARLPSEVLFKDVLEKVGSGRRRGEERWLAHKDGLDFGPFCTEELIQRVRDDEFDEETAVQDLTTGMRRSLCDIPEFDKPLRRFLAERRARAQVEEAAHTARVKTAKKAGKGIFVTGTIGGLALVGGIVWVLAHKPLPKPIEYADVALTIGRALEAPALESPEAIAEQRYKKWRKKRKRARLRAMKAKDRKVVESFGDDGGGGGVTSLDFDEGDDGAPAGPKFSSSSVDRVLARAQPRFDKCLRKELKRNPKLGNVSLAFWVTPKGGTKGAQVKGRSTRLFGKCMVGVVGSLKFPKFSGTQRKISLPFQVTR